MRSYITYIRINVGNASKIFRKNIGLVNIMSNE